MSFLSQTFQAGSSNNTGSVISVVNSTTTPLSDPTSGPNFIGGWISAEKFAVIQVALISNTTVTVVIEQSFEPVGNAEISPIIYQYTHTQLNTLQTIYHYITLPWVKIDIVNTQVGNELFYLSTKLSLTPPPPSSSTQPISGTVSVDNFPATQAVSGTVTVSSITNPLPTGTNAIGSVSVSNFPATQPVSGTVEVSSITSALPTGTNAIGSVSVSNFPAVQDVSGTVTVSSITNPLPTGTNAIGSVVASNLPLITQAGTEGVFCKVSATYIGDTTTVDSSILCYASQGPDNNVRLQIADPSDIPNNDLRELRTTDNSGNILLTSIDGKITACNTGAVVISSGTVAVSNLITETLATRSVYYLVVGNWYRVATVGITSGAVWNEIGAIVAGESIPTIGRLFKCLQNGPNVGGAGTCYDVEYNNDTTVSGTVKIQDSSGGTIATTAGNLMVGIGNIYTANPLHTIVDSGTVGLTASLNTGNYNQAVPSFSFQGTTYDMGENSIVDVLLLASGTITGGDIRLDYSIDGTNWFPNTLTTYTINGADPYYTIIGLKSGSRYIRVSSGVTSAFRADNLQMVFSSKRD